MEFAAPEPVLELWVYFVVPLVILALGSGLVLSAKKRNKDKELSEFWRLGVPVATGVLTIGSIFGLGLYGSVTYDNRAAQAVTAADDRVTLDRDGVDPTFFSIENNYSSSLPHNDGVLIPIRLISTENLQTLDCDALRINDTYRISCLSPMQNDKKVSVDEALKTLENMPAVPNESTDSNLPTS